MTETKTLNDLGSNAGLGAGTYPACKGKNCGCTDGLSHSPECKQEYEDAFNGVMGRCSVPMWMGGCPSGTCGEKSYGFRPPSREWMNYAAGEMMRDDLRYNGYVPGLACPSHGGPKAPNALAKGRAESASSD